MNANTYDFKKISNNFNVLGEYYSCEPYGEGHINQTFLLVTKSEEGMHKYILQRINSTLFTNVPALMQNIQLVTDFAREQIVKAGGDPNRESLTVVTAKSSGNITIPETMEIYYPLLEIIPLQLLAYNTALIKGCEIDKPKNLAKSVTVE